MENEKLIAALKAAYAVLNQPTPNQADINYAKRAIKEALKSASLSLDQSNAA